MPRGPKGEKRPADVIGNAVHVMRPYKKRFTAQRVVYGMDDWREEIEYRLKELRQMRREAAAATAASIAETRELIRQSQAVRKDLIEMHRELRSLKNSN